MGTTKTPEQMTIRRCMAALLIIPTLTIASTLLLGFLGFWLELSLNGDGFLSGVFGALIGGAVGVLGGFSSSLYLLARTRITRSGPQLACMALIAPFVTGLVLGLLSALGGSF